MAEGRRWRAVPVLLVLAALLALGLAEVGARESGPAGGRHPAAALVALPVTAAVVADVRPPDRLSAPVAVVLSNGGTPAPHPVVWWRPGAWIALVLAGGAAWRGRAPPGTGVAVFSARA